ncbi:MAG TPA: MFS transporter [Aliidongia sp.]|nr:MFS transporter [Aliidongia sp.]
MYVLRTLQHPLIRKIWFGQILAATGGEFYTVALVWIAVDLIGSDAGYLSALQAGALLAGSLFAGIVTDGWPHGRTMMTADFGRAAIILLLPIAWAFNALSLGLLLAVAVSSAVVGSTFDPALQATIPVLAKDPDLRFGTNGLFDATRRIARIVGPGLISVAGGLLPTAQFFTVTAAAFVASGLAVRAVTRKIDEAPPAIRSRSLAGAIESLTGGFRAVKGHPVVIYGFIASAVTNGCWGVGVILGIALLMRETEPEPLKAYGLVMSAYGVGNVLTNLVVVSFKASRPAWRITLGRVVFGVGLMGMAISPNLHTLMIVAALTAINGPVTELAMLNLLQASFPLHLLAPTFRVQIALAVAGIFAAYLLAPTLFQLFPVRNVIFGCGVVSTVAGSLGVAYFAWRRAMATATS